MARHPARILIVDDEEIVRETLELILSEVYEDVVMVAGGEAALAALEEREFDLVISDVRMPGIDGIELARRIRERYPKTPVILMSGYGSVSLQAPERGIEPARFLRKPFENFQSVRRMVDQALQERASRAK